MDQFRRNLMLRESESRLRSADLLRTANDEADSAYLLRLLAFELLLKVILEESHGVAPPRHHRYGELFVTLPEEVKDDLIRLASERVGPSALSSDPIRVLNELGSNFIDLRYPYDKYVGMNETQYHQAGMDWISAGSAPQNAVFRYHPEELLGLTYAAQQITAGS